MTTQPEALRLADSMEELYARTLTATRAAAELRRLHSLNQDLLAALKHAAAHAYWTDIERQLYKAIAKAEGEQK